MECSPPIRNAINAVKVFFFFFHYSREYLKCILKSLGGNVRLELHTYKYMPRLGMPDRLTVKYCSGHIQFVDICFFRFVHICSTLLSLSTNRSVWLCLFV